MHVRVHARFRALRGGAGQVPEIGAFEVAVCAVGMTHGSARVRGCMQHWNFSTMLETLLAFRRRGGEGKGTGMQRELKRRSKSERDKT